MRGVWLSPFAPSCSQRSTGVQCPYCREVTLTLSFSCLQTRFSCSHCQRRLDLAELHQALDDDEFETLSVLVEDRHSDRV
jgi:DNA-directed RNA polymerase subunit RPC12/RpoP